MDKSETECYQVAIKGTTHDNFTDLIYILEGDSRMIELQRELIREFFNKYLLGMDNQLEELEKKYPIIRFNSNK